jgi:hypothetical protein
MWKIARFPEVVYLELKALGFPEDIQQYFVSRRSGRWHAVRRARTGPDRRGWERRLTSVL